MNCRREHFALATVFKDCGEKKDLINGVRLHAEIRKKGLLGKSSHLASSLINMYARNGLLTKAREVLEELANPDEISWNALIAGYAQQGQGYEALDSFARMQSEGVYAGAVTFICILKACGSVRAIEKGKQIHGTVLCRDLLKKDVILGTALIHMYAKCGLLTKAHQVLEELPDRNVVTWNVIISGYSEQGQGYEAFNCFEQMQSEGIIPNSVTFICIMKACSRLGLTDKGREFHDNVVSRGFLEKDIILGNTLVSMYVKCGALPKAQQVLEGLPSRNVISWSTIIAGCAEQGQGHEALNCLERMQSEGLFPDVVAFISILKACGSIGAIDKGKHIHNEILCRGWLEQDIMLGTALVDMYAKCGVLGKALDVLEELPNRNVVSWSALITGYAEQGQAHEALSCFEHMQIEGLSPNAVTFQSLLNACNCSGLFEEAEILFETMIKKHNLCPDVEHHACMVMVFGCLGHFDKSLSVIQRMPSCDYLDVWISLLEACRKWGYVELGKLTFDQIIQLDDCSAVAYVLMANIFGSAGMKDDEEKIKAMRLKHTV